MKRYSLIALCLGLLLMASGCQLLGDAPEGPLATPVAESFPSPPPTLEATALAAFTPETLPTATAVTIVTEPPPPTLPPATVEAVATEPPASPTPTALPEVTVTVAAGASPAAPPAGGELFAPGQQDAGQLASGEQALYPFRGQRFTPAVLFVEPENTLDVALAAFTGELGGAADLAGQTPLTEADNAPAGRPETLVLSPDADGLFTFAVEATAGDGGFTVHLYDLTTPANGMAVQEQVSLEAGGSRSFDVTSQGARPVLAMVDPINLSDAILEIFGADGQLLADANFSGAGGVEVAYVLPLGTTSYRIVVREVNGAAAAFDVAIVTLE